MLIAGGYDYGGHAQWRAETFWGIKQSEVGQTLAKPHRCYRRPDGKLGFVRSIRRGRLQIEVIVDDSYVPPRVVTAYPLLD